MKPKRRRPAKAIPGPSSASPPAASSVRRRWFRLLALLSPLVLLVLIEAGLRIAGYGYPTSFFLRSSQDGRSLLVENPRFGWRFFPPAVARSPQPISIAEQKPVGTIRIFLMGESAAMGDPEPAYGVGRQLERLLQARHPDKTIEVVNVAMTAINSHVIREIARDCAARAGDCWLLLIGNNEVVGPFGAGTVFGRKTPALFWVHASLTLKKNRIGQLLSRLVAGRAEPTEWEGMEMFLHQQVSRDDPRLRQVVANFEANLSDIVQCGRRSGAKIVAATLPVNLRDCPPFASAHRAGLSSSDKRSWEQSFARGCQAETNSNFAEALAAFGKAAAVDPGFAEAIFRRGRCELALGQTPVAQQDFRLARDLDTLRFRADSQLNDIVRRTANSRHVALVDAEAECAQQAPQGIPGEEFFYDHVHLNFAGNYWLARLLAPAVEQELFGAANGGTWLSQDEVGARLAWTAFDRRRVGEEMRLRLQQPPFSSQLGSVERDARWRQLLAQLMARPREAVPAYHAALGLALGDWLLHANFARVLEAAGDETGAQAEWRAVARLMPREPDAWFQLGNLAYNAGTYPEAARLFSEALARRPGSTEALNGLGLALAAQGKNTEAMRAFGSALRLKPRYSAARVNLAVVLAKSGNAAQAMAEYRAVLRYETNNVGARINLARLLAAAGQREEAARLYAEAAALAADDPIAQFDLANSLSAEGRRTDAVAHYEAALRAKPDFADAYYNLGLELARLGRLDEALVHFSEAVRLSPDSAPAHFNYGIALAKQQRYAEAVREFTETLRLRPNDVPAHQALDRAQRLSKGGR